MRAQCPNDALRAYHKYLTSSFLLLEIERLFFNKIKKHQEITPEKASILIFIWLLLFPSGTTSKVLQSSKKIVDRKKNGSPITCDAVDLAIRSQFIKENIAAEETVSFLFFTFFLFVTHYFLILILILILFFSSLIPLLCFPSI